MTGTYKINLTAREIGIISELLMYGFSKTKGKEKLELNKKIKMQFIKQLN